MLLGKKSLVLGLQVKAPAYWVLERLARLLKNLDCVGVFDPFEDT